MKDIKIISQEIREILQAVRERLELSFIEEGHIYFMKDKNGNVRNDFPSVSKIIKNFYEPFPAEDIAYKKAKGDRVEMERLLDEWNAAGVYATNMGSRVHYFLEKRAIDMYGGYKDVREPIYECDIEQIIKSNSMINSGEKFLNLMKERGAYLLDTEMVLGHPDLGYVGQPDKVWLIMNKTKTGFGLVISDWKGLPLETPIFTDSGWKTMGTITISDKVYDKDGNLVNIKNISDIKNKKCMKLIFDNREEIISDFEHRWLVFKKNGNVKKEMVMTTQEIYDYYKNLKKRVSYNILKIDITKPLNNPKIDLPIDPYVLGVWLGDGHSVDNKITQANQLVWDEIIRRGYEIGNDLSKGNSGKASTRTVFNLRHSLKKLNLLNNKHIPDIYLLSSFDQRIDLLRGLMDSDGYYNKSRRRFSISTTKKSQIEFATKIISSLGLKSSVIKYNKKLNGKIIQCYNVEFTTTNFNPFLCRNQEINLSNIKIKNKRTNKCIVSIEEVSSIPTRCIEVDSPTNTFLYGHTFSVTHNTNKKKNFQVNDFTKKLKPPFENYPDTALSHYFIQLPLYGRLLLKMLEGTQYENISLLGCIIVLLKDDNEFEEYKVPKDIIDKVMNLDLTHYGI
jgi:hypothetical protein